MSSKLFERMKRMRTAVDKLNDTISLVEDNTRDASPPIMPQELFLIRALLRRHNKHQAMAFMDSIKTKSGASQRETRVLLGLYKEITKYNANPQMMSKIAIQLLIKFERLTTGSIGLKPVEKDALLTMYKVIALCHETHARQIS